MCQYSADDGRATDWHLVHWGQLLQSGAGMFTIEATAVSPEAALRPDASDCGTTPPSDALGDALGVRGTRRHRCRWPSSWRTRAARRRRSGRGKAAQLIPLTTAGGSRRAVAAAARRRRSSRRPRSTPRDSRMSNSSFAETARRAVRIGIDAIELHMAHGYLLHEFLSPLANQRTRRLRRQLRAIASGFRSRCSRRCARRGRKRGRSACASPPSTGSTAAGRSKKRSTSRSDSKALGADWIDVSSGGVSPRQKIALGPGLSRAIRACDPARDRNDDDGSRSHHRTAAGRSDHHLR